MLYKKNGELVEEEVDEFRLLYDSTNGQNLFLNETAGLIWGLLPDQFENILEYKEEFINRFLTETGKETLEKDFDECIDSFIKGGLIYVCDKQ